MCDIQFVSSFCLARTLSLYAPCLVLTDDDVNDEKNDRNYNDDDNDDNERYCS